jgi:hypothetical protein
VWVFGWRYGRPSASVAVAFAGVAVGLRAGEVLCPDVSPTWIWMQIGIVIFVVIGMIIAITKLA